MDSSDYMYLLICRASLLFSICCGIYIIKEITSGIVKLVKGVTKDIIKLLEIDVEKQDK